MLKHCRGCSIDKPLAQFHRDKSKRDGCVTKCKACVLGRNSAWRMDNQEKAAESSRQYRLKHRDGLNEAQRRRYAAKRSAYREKNRAWRDRSKEHVAAYNLWYRAANREVADAAVRRRAERLRHAQVVRFGADQLRARMSYFGDRCWMCGAEADTVDHVKPISKGGLHVLANLRPACRSCNSSKRDQWPLPLSFRSRTA